MKTKQGFTLIELLVVIAIIGILSSVVLASLNTARDKGSDSAIKANLSNARAQAELFYDDNNNDYDPNDASDTGVCAATLDGSIATAVSAAGGTCSSDEDEWVASAELSSGSYFCVDYKGAATTTGATHATTDTNMDCG